MAPKKRLKAKTIARVDKQGIAPEPTEFDYCSYHSSVCVCVCLCIGVVTTLASGADLFSWPLSVCLFSQSSAELPQHLVVADSLYHQLHRVDLQTGSEPFQLSQRLDVFCVSHIV